MTKVFKRGDHVEWNSEAGRVRGVIIRRVASDIRFKGYVHHASKDEPQYLIKSDKTDHIAIHKGRALKRVKARPQRTRVRKKSSRKVGTTRARICQHLRSQRHVYVGLQVAPLRTCCGSDVAPEFDFAF